MEIVGVKIVSVIQKWKNMIGSHNALSYLSPKGLKSKLLNKWAKCQEVNYISQYYTGTRCFDIHIKFEKNQPVIVHNNVTYKGNKDTIMQVLGFFNNMKDCYIRWGLDIRKKPKDANNQVALFKTFVTEMHEKYPFVTRMDAIVYWDWSRPFGDTTYQVYEKHASVTSTWELLKTPKNYAQNNNAKLKAGYKEIVDADNKVLLIDYVNI
jgi:hypothetical protein